MRVLFVAGFGPVVADPEAGGRFYVEALGIPFQAEGAYLHTGELPGVKHFALWPLEDAARSCFGQAAWPADLPVPQGWLEFDVEDVDAATAELVARGYRLLVANRLEPWGQTVTRLLGPEGLLLGVTCTPALR